MPRLLIGNVKGVKGDTGAQGERGLAGTIEVGSVQTVTYGSAASVTNSGTETEAILDFQIPQGAPGAQVTDMSNLVLNTITDSTSDYPAFAVSETGSTIFGKIRKFLSDLKNNYVSKAMMTISTDVDTAGQAVADAKAIKSLNDSLSNCATKTDLADCVRMPYVNAEIPANSTSVRVTASVPSGYSFIGWCYCSSVGWLGHVYASSNEATATFYTSSGSSSSARRFNAFYLVRKNA